MRFALPLAGSLDRLRGDAWARLRRLVPAWREAARPQDVSPPTAAPPAPPAIPAADARALWADRLWGAGFTLPGGEAELLRLAQLLPLSPATTLLLLGRDEGGATRAIAEHHRAWVAVHQHDPKATARMAPLLRPFGRRATVQRWDPAAPAFRAGFHHHALALEPFRAGALPESLAPALAAAMKPGGQLVLVDAVLTDPAGAALDRWLALDGRAALPPDRDAVEHALHAAGFTLHVAEHLGARQDAAAREAWLRLLAALREGGRPAAGPEAAALVTEAEAWLLRQRLLSAGAIAVLRWHATRRG